MRIVTFVIAVHFLGCAEVHSHEEVVRDPADAVGNFWWVTNPTTVTSDDLVASGFQAPDGAMSDETPEESNVFSLAPSAPEENEPSDQKEPDTAIAAVCDQWATLFNRVWTYHQPYSQSVHFLDMSASGFTRYIDIDIMYYQYYSRIDFIIRAPDGTTKTITDSSGVGTHYLRQTIDMGKSVSRNGRWTITAKSQGSYNGYGFWLGYVKAKLSGPCGAIGGGGQDSGTTYTIGSASCDQTLSRTRNHDFREQEWVEQVASFSGGTNVQVEVNASFYHERPQDVHAVLVGPKGQSVDLWNRQNSASKTFSVSTVLHDWQGVDTTGDWKLRFIDTRSDQYIGYLDSWSIKPVCSCPANYTLTATQQSRCSQFCNAMDNTCGLLDYNACYAFCEQEIKDSAGGCEDKYYRAMLNSTLTSQLPNHYGCQGFALSEAPQSSSLQTALEQCNTFLEFCAK